MIKFIIRRVSDGIGRNTFMIRVNGQVKANQLGEFLVAETQHGGEILGPVFVSIDRTDR